MGYYFKNKLLFFRNFILHITCKTMNIRHIIPLKVFIFIFLSITGRFINDTNGRTSEKERKLAYSFQIPDI